MKYERRELTHKVTKKMAKMLTFAKIGQGNRMRKRRYALPVWRQQNVVGISCA
jgi:hypothetical protein